MLRYDAVDQLAIAARRFHALLVILGFEESALSLRRYNTHRLSMKYIVIDIGEKKETFL